MFAWVRKLFRQTVNWFRPENGGHALIIPVHPSPPRSTPVYLGPSLSALRITHEPANSEAPPAAAHTEPSPPGAGPPPPEKVARQPRLQRERDQWLHPIHKPRSSGAPRIPRKPHSAIELEVKDDPTVVFPADKTHDWDIRPQSEDTGVFYFRGALLDRLDYYFRAVGRMKKAHRDAYHLYTQLGGTMIPHSMLGAAYHLPAFWHEPEKRPTFGCVHLGRTAQEDQDTANGDRGMLQLMYFEKETEPGADVERAPGADIYVIHAYLDDLDYKTHSTIRSKRWRRHLEYCGFVFEFWVAIEPNGDMRPLKTLQTEWKEFTYRAGTYRYGKTRKQKYSEAIPQKHWAYPYNLRWWWKELHEEHKDDPRHPTTIEEWSCSLFRLITNFALASEFAIRVSVENEHQHRAVFALDWKRTSYFFKDRDAVLTPKGKTARIFHIVKPHLRKKADGTETAVHLHFRGLRRFSWGKYKVHITVPGLHHIPLTDFTVGLVDTSGFTPEERRAMHTTKHLGKELAEHLDERKKLGELFKTS